MCCVKCDLGMGQILRGDKMSHELSQNRIASPGFSHRRTDHGKRLIRERNNRPNAQVFQGYSSIFRIIKVIRDGSTIKATR